ncbi:Ankyrin repeat-containing domain [Pseudocohnilembus persalinus]|uniref:Ankyrin repeat-containing domain n=1 Tax=Pseudocohnilembus persalinus TaxID=266149 RepID=A0A0V0QWH5_PSEPJ|nr:Ankyrin repeat-containing domain [Pseudocohnilembus persalinus]|eukprot:KRX06578.1 Ankyrin repeat-containing domain [Pseudocohnilembus persalinus]
MLIQQQPKIVDSIQNNEITYEDCDRLNYASSKIDELPSSFLELRQTVKEINLSDNLFIQFPEDLAGFGKLKVLKMDKNLLTFLPQQIGFLRNLEVLTISNNFIQELPPTLKNLNNLLLLNVGCNNLVKFGKEVTSLKNLRTLYIYKNNFTELPNSFHQLTNLAELSLDWFRFASPTLPVLQMNKDVLQKIQRLSQNLYNQQMQVENSQAEIEKLQKQGYQQINLNRDNINIQSGQDLNQNQIQGEQKRESFNIGFEEFIKAVSVNKDIQLDKVDGKNRNIIFNAAQYDEVGILLAVNKIHKNLIHQIDKENHTPFSLALQEEMFKSARTLLHLKIDPTKGGGNQGSPLHIAVQKMNQEFVQKILYGGGNANCTDFEQNTPLHIIFSIFGREKQVAAGIAEALLNSGADPNQPNKELWSPLHVAVRRGQSSALRWALQFNKVNQDTGQKLFDFNKRGGQQKWSLSHIAANYGNLEVLEVLSEANAYMFSCTKNFQTPRNVALQSLILYKIMRKYEEKWILLNILSQQSQYDNYKLIDENDRSVQNLNSMIKQTMEKKAEFLKQNAKDYILAFSTNKDKMMEARASNPFEQLIKENDDIWDPENEIQQMTTEGDQETMDVEEFDVSERKQEGNNVKNNAILLSRNVRPVQNQIVNIEKKNREVFEGELNEELNFDLAQIKSLSVESFITELKRISGLVAENEAISLGEKLKLINYLKIIHLRITQKQVRFYSEVLPINIYIINEFFYNQEDRMSKERIQLIPKIFQKMIEKLMFRYNQLSELQEEDSYSRFAGYSKFDNNKGQVQILMQNLIQNLGFWNFKLCQNTLMEVFTMLDYKTIPKISISTSKFQSNINQNKKDQEKEKDKFRNHVYHDKLLSDYEAFQQYLYLNYNMKLNNEEITIKMSKKIDQENQNLQRLKNRRSISFQDFQRKNNKNTANSACDGRRNSISQEDISISYNDNNCFNNSRNQQQKKQQFKLQNDEDISNSKLNFKKHPQKQEIQSQIDNTFSLGEENVEDDDFGHSMGDFLQIQKSNSVHSAEDGHKKQYKKYFHNQNNHKNSHINHHNHHNYNEHNKNKHNKHSENSEKQHNLSNQSFNFSKNKQQSVMKANIGDFDLKSIDMKEFIRINKSEKN